jgi:hypothetical protein
MAVHIDNSEEEDRAKAAFKQHGAHDISSTSESSVPKPKTASAR